MLRFVKWNVIYFTFKYKICSVCVCLAQMLKAVLSWRSTYILHQKNLVAPFLARYTLLRGPLYYLQGNLRELLLCRRTTASHEMRSSVDRKKANIWRDKQACQAQRLSGIGESSTSSVGSEARILRLIKILRLLRIARILKLVKFIT